MWMLFIPDLWFTKIYLVQAPNVSTESTWAILALGLMIVMQKFWADVVLWGWFLIKKFRYLFSIYLVNFVSNSYWNCLIWDWIWKLGPFRYMYSELEKVSENSGVPPQDSILEPVPSGGYKVKGIVKFTFFFYQKICWSL